MNKCVFCAITILIINARVFQNVLYAVSSIVQRPLFDHKYIDYGGLIESSHDHCLMIKHFQRSLAEIGTTIPVTYILKDCLTNSQQSYGLMSSFSPLRARLRGSVLLTRLSLNREDNYQTSLPPWSKYRKHHIKFIEITRLE